MSETVSSVEPIEKEPVVEEKPSETTEGDQTVPPADKALPAEVEKEKAAAAAEDQTATAETDAEAPAEPAANTDVAEEAAAPEAAPEEATEQTTHTPTPGTETAKEVPEGTTPVEEKTVTENVDAQEVPAQ